MERIDKKLKNGDLVAYKRLFSFVDYYYKAKSSSSQIVGIFKDGEIWISNDDKYEVNI